MERCIVMCVKIPYRDGADYVEGADLIHIQRQIMDAVTHQVTWINKNESFDISQAESVITND